MQLTIFTLAALAGSVLAVPAPAPTPAAIVPRGDCETKTLFGPYTLSYPIFGYDQSDTFYAEQLPDGAYVFTGHGSHDSPILHDEDQPALLLDPAGGIGGAIVGTESIFGKTYIGTLGGTLGPAHSETCGGATATTTVTVTKGNPFFPTGSGANWPFMPKETKA